MRRVRYFLLTEDGADRMRIVRVSLNDCSLELKTRFNDAKAELFETFLRQANGAQVADFDCSETEFHIRVSQARHTNEVNKMVHDTMTRYQVGYRVELGQQQSQSAS